MERITLTANGLVHPALKLGAGNRLALLLHGFPDTPFTWSKLMPQLAAQGYTCIAPYLRGYSPLNTPPELVHNPAATVQIADLAEDVVALIGAAGFTHALIVGHDWGAIAGYAAASLAPERCALLVALSVPHPKVFLSNLWKNLRQILMSWYIFFFQLRMGIPENWVRKNHMEFIAKLWQTWSPGLATDEPALAQAQQLLSDPQILHNALAYYRGLLTPPWSDWPRWQQSLRLALADTEVPALVLAGSRDGCVSAELYEGMQAVVRNEFVLRILPTVGHFLPLESDTRIAAEIRSFNEKYEVRYA